MLLETRITYTGQVSVRHELRKELAPLLKKNNTKHERIRILIDLFEIFLREGGEGEEAKSTPFDVEVVETLKALQKKHK